MSSDVKRAKKYSTWQIAATYIGTVVGAGFASGQEVLQFFGYFGLRGVIGLVLATVLFIFFGYLVILKGFQLKAESHLPVMRNTGGPLVGRAVDIITTFFLFGALAVMAAGAGAIFTQEFGLPMIMGSSFLLIITLITVILGIEKVIGSISLVAPVLIVSVLGISFYAVLKFFPNLSSNLSWSDVPRAAVSYWPLASFLYVSYNLVLAVAVLAPLGALAGRKELLPGAVLGGLGLGAGALAITAALLATAPVVTSLEVPMLYIAGTFSPWLRKVYSIILLAEVYTTGVSSLYGFSARLTKPGSNIFYLLATGASAAALLASIFGFSRLVATIFPLVGYAGFLLLGTLLYAYLKEVPVVRRIIPAGIYPVPVRKLLIRKDRNEDNAETSEKEAQYHGEKEEKEK